MKGIKHTYLFILFATMTAVMVACSSDNSTDGRAEGFPPSSDNGKLTLRIATQSVTRATWVDTNATDDEMMNIWVVVLTDNSDVVQKVFACKPTNTDGQREIDEVCQISKGDYHAYSFANISVAKVADLLGITITMSTMSADNTVYEATAVSGTVNADKAVTVNGNNFNKFTSSDDNGFGSYGIPMSNVQTIAATDTEKDLIVVRMLAKIKLSIKNETGADVTVKKITLTDVTSNEADNLKLLPSLTTAANADDMEAHHQDVRPNLYNTPTTTDFVVLSTDKAIANGLTENVTFYVNESATPANNGGLFQLSLELDGGEYRYSLISNNAQYEWNYIARNDYRIIPITLDDYKFELIPYDFPPIGVYPVSVKELNTSENLYEFTFHDYGHFHLLPKVTKGGSTDVNYNVGSGDYWTLNTDWGGTWSSWTDNTKATLATDDGTFYRSGYTTDPPEDGDDVGGFPVWYPNTLGKPQWDPAASDNYQPFIFGYIADPGSSMTEDKKIYHEMKIKLYVGGNYRRDMIYRFYMTLSREQMLYAPRRADAPRRRH